MESTTVDDNDDNDVVGELDVGNEGVDAEATAPARSQGFGGEPIAQNEMRAGNRVYLFKRCYEIGARTSELPPLGAHHSSRDQLPSSNHATTLRIRTFIFKIRVR